MGCGVIDKLDKNCFENNISNKINQLYLDESFPPSNNSIFGKENLEKIKIGKKIPYS